MGPKSNNNNNKRGVKDQPIMKPNTEYTKKRERNNVAVRRSREKSKQKQKETLEKVNRLRVENEELEMKVTLLSKELSVLRDLFLEHAGVSQSTSSCCQGSHDVNTNDSEECPVNTLAAKMDHEYTAKPFSTPS